MITVQKGNIKTQPENAHTRTYYICVYLRIWLLVNLTGKVVEPVYDLS